MSKMVAGHTFINDEMTKALGLPENTFKMTLTAEVGAMVRINCEYYPTLVEGENAERLVSRIKSFTLVEQSDEEADVDEPDSDKESDDASD